VVCTVARLWTYASSYGGVDVFFLGRWITALVDRCQIEGKVLETMDKIHPPAQSEPTTVTLCGRC
jgi:hypothetical protein